MLNYCEIPLRFLKFEGNDRLDLINRLSTNKADNLDAYEGIKTVLTSDRGRFVDLLTLYNFGDFVFAACSNQRTDAVIAHLDKYTIMDDFKITDMSGTHETILFYGQNADKFAREQFNIDISGFSNCNFGVYSTEDKHSIIARNDDAFGGFLFICASEDYDFHKAKLFKKELKEKFHLNKISQEEYEFKRIELGIPRAEREMTDETNPLECGLEKYVSFTKGCYIGQEVIARLNTYDKINKHMAGLEFSFPLTAVFQPGEAKIIADDKECGFVTSYAAIRDKAAIGLGFVKTVFLDFGKKYKVRLEGKETECKLIKSN